METMNEAKLIEKLRLIEAPYAGGTERAAAAHARQRILERLRSMEIEDPPVEYRFSMGDMWSRRVFVALLRRYGLTPYRYRRQRYTTVMVKVSKKFVDETLWPQFQQLSETLRAYLSDVTDRVVAQVINEDFSEAVVISEQQALPLATFKASATSSNPAGAGAGSTGKTGEAQRQGSGGGDSDSGNTSGQTARNKQKLKRKPKRRKKRRG